MLYFNLPNLTDRLKDALRRQLQGLTSNYKFLQIIVGAVFPIVEGYLASKISAENVQANLVVLLILIGLLHICLLALLVRTEKPLSQFLVEFDE